MSLLAFVAFVFGIAGVWLTVKTSIWCWPVALISVLASAAEFYQVRLYGDMCLQAVYFIAGLYGWYYWNKKARETFKVEKTPPGLRFWLIVMTLLQCPLYYFLLLKFKGDQAFLDALLTSASLTATYMMSRKWRENWIAWVFIDLTYMILYSIKLMPLFALLYLFFAAMAYFGWRTWKTEG